MDANKIFIEQQNEMSFMNIELKLKVMKLDIVQKKNVTFLRYHSNVRHACDDYRSSYYFVSDGKVQVVIFERRSNVAR